MKQRLDKNLLAKLIIKTGKSEKYLREQISKKANKLGIYSEAVLVILAKQAGIGTSRYQRLLSPHIQAEIRSIYQANGESRKQIIIEKTIKGKRNESANQNFVERMVSDIISKVIIGVLKPSS